MPAKVGQKDVLSGTNVWQGQFLGDCEPATQAKTFDLPCELLSHYLYRRKLACFKCQITQYTTHSYQHMVRSRVFEPTFWSQSHLERLVAPRMMILLAALASMLSHCVRNSACMLTGTSCSMSLHLPSSVSTSSAQIQEVNRCN